jgi:hypothetical protein
MKAICLQVITGAHPCTRSVAPDFTFTNKVRFNAECEPAAMWPELALQLIQSGIAVETNVLKK